MALSVLNEIKDLPSRVSDPNWLDKLENGDGEQESFHGTHRAFPGVSGVLGLCDGRLATPTPGGTRSSP